MLYQIHPWTISVFAPVQTTVLVQELLQVVWFASAVSMQVQTPSEASWPLQAPECREGEQGRREPDCSKRLNIVCIFLRIYQIILLQLYALYYLYYYCMSLRS